MGVGNLLADFLGRKTFEETVSGVDKKHTPAFLIFFFFFTQFNLRQIVVVFIFYAERKTPFPLHSGPFDFLDLVLA